MGKFLLLVVLFFSFPANAFQVCECGPEGTPSENFDRAFAVFTGTVEDVFRKFTPDRFEITFKVHKSWKGARNEKIKIYTSGRDAFALIREGLTCGYNFEKNKTYLVYSYRDKNRHGPSFVSYCGGTKPIEQAEQDMEQFPEPIFSFE